MKPCVRRLAGFGPLVALSLGASIASAQSAAPKVVPDSVSCASCRIVVTPRRELQRGGAADLTGIGVPMAVRRDRLGRYWLLQWQQPPRIFDSTGKFLHTVGRLGPGPGEYRNPIDAVEVSGDSILIIDQTAARGALLDPRLRPARHVALPAGPVIFPGVVGRWPDNMIVNVLEEGRRGDAGPLLRVSLRDARARVIQSFGSQRAAPSPDMEASRHIIAQGAQGRFWSADNSLFRLTLWSPAGVRLMVLDRRPTWFPLHRRATRPWHDPIAPGYHPLPDGPWARLPVACEAAAVVPPGASIA